MPASYYCHICGEIMGLIKPIDIHGLNMTGSYTGQLYTPLDKYFKHTHYTGQSGIVSVYNDPDYGTYRQYGINTYLSGCVEVDHANRVNLLWYAGKDIGLRYNNGHIEWPEDTVKLVLHDNTFKFHHYSQAAVKISVGSCYQCGRVIPFS